MNRKKRILYFAESMGSGVMSFLVDLTNQLSDFFDIYIAYGVRSETPANLRKYFNKNIHLIRVKNFTRSINPNKDIRAFFEMKKIAIRVKPDIIHLNSSKAGALGRWAFNGKKVPVFYTPHGYSFLMSNYGSTKQKLFKLIEKICAMRNCTTISCSLGEQKESLKLTKRAIYVNNGININELQLLIDKNKKKIHSHPLTVFTLGRISFQKNPELFNQIAKSLPNIHFIWIGDGELRNRLTSPNIEITGWLTRENAIVKAMNSDIFILTSLWEGLPISLLEAMYMKKLCIVSDVLGNRDVIKNKKNGYVSENTTDFVNNIKGFFYKQITNKIVSNAYNDVLRNYNSKIMAEEYKKIYQGLEKWK